MKLDKSIVMCVDEIFTPNLHFTDILKNTLSTCSDVTYVVNISVHHVFASMKFAFHRHRKKYYSHLFMF